MGGPGSGRTPDTVKMMMTQGKELIQFRTPEESQVLEIPNYSGLKPGTKIQDSVVWLKNTGDTGTGKYIITQTGTDPERIQTTDRNGVVKARLGYIASSGVGPGQIYLYDTSGNGSVIINGGTGNSYLNGLGGNVGVGTTIPLNILEVSGSTSQFSVTNAGTSVLQVSGSNVGIATTSPSSKLHVVGSSYTASSLTDAFNSPTFRVQTQDLATPSSIFMFNVASHVEAIQGAYSTSGTSDLSLQPFGGSVGIGTTSPRVKTDIWGGALAEPTPLANAVAAGTLVIADSTGTVGSAIGVTTHSSSYDTYIQARNLGAGSTAYNLNLQPLGGNVGIGTTNPMAALEVSGSILISGGCYFKGNAANGYRFNNGSDTTNLMVLTDVGNLEFANTTTTNPTLNLLSVSGSIFISGGQCWYKGSSGTLTKLANA